MRLFLHLAALGLLLLYAVALAVLVFLEGISYLSLAVVPIPFVLVLFALGRHIRAGWVLWLAVPYTAAVVLARLWIDLWLPGA